VFPFACRRSMPLRRAQQ